MDAEQTEIVMYTTSWCSDCWRAKQVLATLQIAYQEIDIAHDEEALEHVMRLNGGNRSVPTLVFPDGSVLTEPKPVALMQKLQHFV